MEKGRDLWYAFGDWPTKLNHWPGGEPMEYSMEERCGVHMPCREIICGHYPRNPQCLGSRCPYHPASE